METVEIGESKIPIDTNIMQSYQNLLTIFYLGFLYDWLSQCISLECLNEFELSIHLDGKAQRFEVFKRKIINL